jgi:hypothetical protein
LNKERREYKEGTGRQEETDFFNLSGSVVNFSG